MLKKQLIKSTSLFLAIILACSMCLTVSALTSQVSEYPGIVEALRAVEYIKDDMGLEDIDFRDFTVGEPIYAYDYVENKFEKTRNYYPLLIDGVLTALAIEISEGEASVYQIVTDLVPEINSYIRESHTPIALIFDSSAAYVLCNGTLNLLSEFSEEVPGRSTLYDDADFTSLHLQNWFDSYSLNYTIPMSTYEQVYFACNVRYVTQKPYKYLCWAACVASVANGRNGTSLTAADVSKKTFRSDTVIDIPRNMLQTVLTLRDNYNIDNYVVRPVPANDTLFGNIKRGYPVFAGFVPETNTNAGKHMILVNAMHITAGYTYALDPMRGEIALPYSSDTCKFYYVSTDNIRYKWNESACIYW